MAAQRDEVLAVVDVSLTSFVDIVRASGTAKLTAVRRVKQQQQRGYNRATDFYGPLRDRIRDGHRRGLAPKYVSDLMPTVTDPKKLTAYPTVIQGHKKWWGRKKMEWFDPARVVWSAGKVNVTVNPELGVRINGGDPYLIKLYFKAEPLSKRRIDVILHLLAIAAESMNGKTPPPRVGVLDLRRGRLIEPTVPKQNLDLLLTGEAAFIESVWPNL